MKQVRLTKSQSNYLKLFFYSIFILLLNCNFIYSQTLNPNKLYTISIKSAKGKVLNVTAKSKSNGAKITSYNLNSEDAANQQFYVKSAGKGYYYFFNKNSNKVIDANKTTSSVSQWAYHGGDNQKWKLVPKPEGYYCIQNKYTSKYFDITSKGSLIQFGFHGGNNQQFKFQTASTVNTPVVNNTTTKSPKNIFFPSKTNSKFRNGLNAYANNDGWNSKKHFRTVSDFNGDSHMDLIGFGDHSVYVSYGNSKMEFVAAKTITKEQFTGKQGWNSEVNERLVVDLNGDNRVDLAGFSKFGLAVSYQLPNGSLKKSETAKGSEEFGNGNYWSAKKHVRTLADVNNDGYMDIIGFGDANTYIALGTKYGTFGKGIAFHGFCTSDGWDAKKHERLVADVNNDGKKDLVGFGENAVYAAFGNGNGTFQKGINILNNFSAAQGYNTTVHKRQVADINADGKQDLIAFADHKIYVALGKGNGVFSKAKPATGVMSANSGWRSDKHNRWAIDINNDNKVDLVGFGDKGVTIAFSKSSSNTINYNHIVTPRAAFSSKNWMSDIKDNINLKDLTIPGTHDSGADYGCPDYSYSKYGKCQDMTISQQLEAGVRYLDIRLKYNKNEDKLRIQHGKCYQEDHFGKVLSDIKNFFTKNPTEAIIMRIKDEDDDTDAAIFTNRFNQYIRNYSNIIYNGTDIPNLGTARGKIIIVDFSYKFNNYHPHGSQITPKGEWYYDGENKYDRWSLNWEQMVNCNSSNEPRSKLWFSAFNQNGLNWDVDDVNSFFESATNVIGGALTTTATPRDISEYMIPKLEQDLNKPEYKKGTFGMVVLDFPSKKLIRQLIETNNIPSKRKY